jgi:predicted nucleotidyltransferase
MVTQQTIDTAVNKLAEAAHPEQIIFFGTHARGDAREDPDVDLLVVVCDLPQPRREMARLRRELAPLGIPVDVLVVSKDQFDKWSEAPSTTLYWAKREGKVLYDAA